MFQLKIIHRYLYASLTRNILLSLTAMVLLFLIIDVIDRIDNILPHDPGFLVAFQYFTLKIPEFVVFCLPISFMIATLFTYGLLSKKSEITAMRASGMKLIWLAFPLLTLGMIFSLINLFLAETIVPQTVRSVKEIYNIDIRKKDASGIYNQEKLWWRQGSQIYSSDLFDSRDSTLHQLTRYDLNADFDLLARTDSDRTSFVSSDFGWRMFEPEQRFFKEKAASGELVLPGGIKSYPLLINETPEDFYNTDLETSAMSYNQLNNYINKSAQSGEDLSHLAATLAAKRSFPFVVLICALAVFPFSIRPARTGSMAASFLAGVGICFAYYAVHSVSIALGQAQIVNPLLAAWTANILLALVGAILLLGAESPE